MKRERHSSPSKHTEDEMLAHYEFDFRKARPNRFAGCADKDTVIVVLDPDVSKVFSTPQAVNTALRALITAMPATAKPKTARRRSA